jgi:hypothetical protein
MLIQGFPHSGKSGCYHNHQADEISSQYDIPSCNEKAAELALAACCS